MPVSNPHDTATGGRSDELWCPFPSLLNRHAEQADRESFAWMAQHRLLDGLPERAERLRRQRSGALAARTNPEAGAEMLRLLADWYVWLFAFDDGYGEDPERGGPPGPLARTTALLARVLDADLPLTELTGTARAYAVALREIRDRIRVHASPPQLVRWERTVCDYLSAQVWEATNREASAVPGLAEYVAMRRHAGATYTCLALIDIVGGYELPPAQADGPTLRRLADITANLVSWDNDLYSHAKERAGGQGRHNLVEVLARHHRCSPSAARDRALAMRDREMNHFIEACEAVSADAAAPTAVYARSLGLWLRGHIDWSRGSSRFDTPSPAASRP
ncbi:hypothetical protein [Kitasatospora sp. NPDC091276]|uniref:terpene synthase family protein n=1 Tax=Kitasatospora sp. NPDC091276 TaxID=3155300 RepID=UPI003444CA0D